MQHINVNPTQPPQGGTQITSRALVVTARPQRACRMPATDPAAIQGHEDQQPFAALWNLESSTILDHDRAAKQAESGRTHPIGGCVLVGE
jgi:hypothetical protein